jgi:2,3-dihydro-2,3-dihydroxybenzoate dehydrogenase
MQDELAVVVGGANGIGAAIAERLVADRSCGRLVVADIDMPGVRRQADSLHGRGVEVAEHQVDVCDQGSVDGLVADTADASWLVVASGIFGTDDALSVTRDAFRRAMAVNGEGVFFVVQAYAREMAARGRGSVVAVASVAARVPRVRQVAYGASKAALRQALRVLALEVAGSGVRINTVSPGLTATRMMDQMSADAAAVSNFACGDLSTFRPRIPRGTVALPQDVAAVVAFLLRDAAHMTIQDLVVDGGELLGM